MKWFLPLLLLAGCNEEKGVAVSYPNGYHENVTILDYHYRPDYIEIKTEDGRYLEIHGTYVIIRKGDE